MKKSMKTLLKSLLLFLLFTIIIVVSIFTTSTGQTLLYLYLGDKISSKSSMEVKVLSLDFHQYPDFSGELLIKDDYKLDIHGALSFTTLDLDFSVTSNCITSNFCRIEDDINVTGKLYGKFRDFTIKGQGKLLDGTIHFDGLKKRRSFENINIILSDINSTKFFTALDEKPIFNGTSDINIHFDTVGKKSTLGQITYHVKDNNFSNENIVVTLDASANIRNKKYTFDIDMVLPTSTIKIREGKYDQKAKYGTAKFILDIQELADIEGITKVELIGPFYATGNIILDQKIKMKGSSESFGGVLDIAYENKKFHFDLKEIPFNSIMNRLKLDPILDAKMIGVLNYDAKEKELYTKVKLKDVTFLQQELNDLVQEKFGHALHKEIFPYSSFEASYKEDVLSSQLTIANETNYLIFKDIKLDAKERSMDTTIDFQIQKHNIAGELYIRNDGHTRHSIDSYLTFDGVVEKHYKLKLNGPLGRKWINMEYQLSAARVPSHLVTIEDDINITGQLYGPYTRLYIRGEGTALDGKVSFDSLKVYNELKDFNLKMTNIHANKLYTLVGLTDLPHGKASVEAHFKYLSKEHKKGSLSYTLKDAYYETLPLNLTSEFHVDNILYTFSSDINLNGAKINILNGKHDETNSTSHASFILDIQDIGQMEALLGHKYIGPFYAKGKMSYKEGWNIRGLSKTFGGETDFLYKNDILYVDFIDASFKNIMLLLDLPVYLDARTNGSINYDFKKELLLVNAKLDDAKFVQSDLVEKAYDNANINLLYETFDASELDIKYQNNVITGSIKLANLKNHIYLSNILINTEKESVNAYFDLHLQNKEFSGKIYGSLNKPKINLNMQKLIQHEMDKQIDSMGGKAPREMMEDMPMGDVAKDVFTGTAGSFMGIFF